MGYARPTTLASDLRTGTRVALVITTAAFLPGFVAIFYSFTAHQPALEMLNIL